MTSVESIPYALRALSDETRLRILSLLQKAELSVGEIARCLATGQSRISNHLKILREMGWIGERHEGSYTFCRLEVPTGHLGNLWEALAPSLESLGHRDADQARLAVVLAERTDTRAFFDRIAGDWDVIGSDFETGTGRLEALGCLVSPQLVVADIGCGTGYLAGALGSHVRRLICVDSSEAMLSKARDNLNSLDCELEFREGVMEALPLADNEVDAACAHMVLHHLADSRPGLKELARTVKPGGTVVCLEMLPHHETWMHETMADTRLGIEPEVLDDDLRAVGLSDIRRQMLTDRYVVESPAGKSIRLPLYLTRARCPD
ncbi:MAG: metalloregulator ArsR/SmtB family transcription factor [Planctomycetota bacterium]|nr:metalloregulator ArsR/SmtB family transcription factor [Planctomycetota bacterium]